MIAEQTHRIFWALGDETRQALLDWLVAEGKGTATELSGRLPISRQAVSRHLGEMEAAGLLSSEHVGRETIFRPSPNAFDVALTWLSRRARMWDSTLQRLKSHAEERAQS